MAKKHKTSVERIEIEPRVLTSQEREIRRLRKDLSKYYAGMAEIQSLRIKMKKADAKELLDLLHNIDGVARECQAGNYLYSERKQTPAQGSVSGKDSKSVAGRDTGPVLRGKQLTPVDGVQIPVFGAPDNQAYKSKSLGQTQSLATKMDWAGGD